MKHKQSAILLWKDQCRRCH